MPPLATLFTIGATLLTDAPELEAAIQQDIADLSGGSVTVAQLTARWQGMNAGWAAAKAKWQAAAPQPQS